MPQHRRDNRKAPVSGSGWLDPLRRVGRALLLRPRAQRRRGWSTVVPVVLFAAGLLITATATTARGTQLRSDRRVELRELIRERKQDVNRAEERAGGLRREIEGETRNRGGSDARISEQQRRADEAAAAAGLTPLRGPGLTVKLNDAQRRPGEPLPPGATPDDLVVHQQDVQAVVNALWAGGGEAMTIMGVRVISTSAVRCVGNTLLLHNQVYSPPFVITAIGDPARLEAALDASPGVRLFRDAARDFGLGYEVKEERDVLVPAYTGSDELPNAEVPR